MTILWLIPGIIAVALFTLSLISQRGKHRGLVDGKLAPLPNKPNCVSSEPGTDEDKRVDPLSSDKEGIKSAIRDTGGTITSESDDYISATYTSKIFRFVDDVELRREGDIWHVRSASRVGHSDMGANRKRVQAIRSALN